MGKALDFTKFDSAFDAEDYEWMNQHAGRHLAAIEELVSAGATPLQIKQYAQRRVSVDRQGFVARCEGAARYLRSLQVD